MSEIASVQARFFVQKITLHAHLGQAAGVAELAPVSRGPENKQWAAATPTGAIQMTISNPAAMAWFKDRLGREVAITFEDRPIVCPVCNLEIANSGQYQSTTDSQGREIHPSCKAKL